jgi:hypothetical protein
METLVVPEEGILMANIWIPVDPAETYFDHSIEPSSLSSKTIKGKSLSFKFLPAHTYY